MKLSELAAALGCRLQGDEDLEISGVRGVEQAVHGHLTFLANPKYGAKVKQTKASAILVSEPIPGIDIAFLNGETLAAHCPGSSAGAGRDTNGRPLPRRCRRGGRLFFGSRFSRPGGRPGGRPG